MRTKGQLVLKSKAGELLCLTDKDARYVVDRFVLGDRPDSEHQSNAEFIKAAWNACDRLNLTADQLNSDAIGKLVEAAKAAHEALYRLGYCASEPETRGERAYAGLEAALAPFTEQPNAEAE